MTGKGEKVDVALVDSVVSAMQNINMIYTTEGRIPQRIGNRYESTYPYDSFEAKDGDVIIAAANDRLYQKFCKLIGREDLITDERFATIQDRLANHVEMKEEIEKWSKQHTIDEISDLLNDNGIPSCPINTVDRVVKDKHIAGVRNMFPKQNHPVAGEIVLTNNAIKFTETTSDPHKPAPQLGEHNDYILTELLGYSEEDLKAFKENKVI